MKKIPKLRFKEFKDDWQREKLHYLSELIKDGTHGTHKDVKNGIFLLSAKDIKDGKIQIQKDCRKISFNDFGKIHKNYILQNKDLLLTIVGTIGEVGMVENYNRNYTFQRSVAIIRLQKQKLNPKYGLQYFKTNIFQTFLKNKTNSSAQAGVYLGELSKIDMSFPSLEEQKKIADFLSSVDVKINLTENKLELLKEYKKGIMQKIFNRELRFKDENGNDYPNWEEKELKELLELIIDNRGKTPPNSENKSLIPLLEVNSVGERKINYKKVTKFVTEETYNTWFRGHIIRNDILFSTVGATALCSVYKNEKKSVIAQNLVGLRIKKNYVPDYVYSLIKETKNNSKFKSIEMIAVQPSIKVSQMVGLKFRVSVSYKEQQKIANFLSSIDTKIEKISNELENLKEFKKGLLQQMFV